MARDIHPSQTGIQGKINRLLTYTLIQEELSIALLETSATDLVKLRQSSCDALVELSGTVRTLAVELEDLWISAPNALTDPLVAHYSKGDAQ